SKQDISLKAGIFGAEPWTNEMRREIEAQLGIKAYDIYGLTEIIGPGVAYECEEQTGMHVNEDHFLVEVIDPETGRVLPEGTQGELVFSCITKEAFPILRYRTRDIGVITRKPCSCGRTLVKMTKPRGRTDDMLIVRGVNVFPSQIETVLLEHGYTANYQIVVDRASNIDSIEVHVEISSDIFSDTVKALSRKERKLEEALQSLLGIAAKVKLLEPNTIERSVGKAVRVIDKRKLLD
ncbi:MAG TPA: AMP-binding protein, partial [Clostridia bacterium]|nr:AMP-binding protein [Clostridia bacterium]